MSRIALLREYFASRRNGRLNEQELLLLQRRGVKSFLTWALEHSPYTKERFAKRSPDEWRDVPAIGKAEMMANFDGLNTKGIKLADALAIAKSDEASRDFDAKIDGISIGLSSGTSGKLGLFAVSDLEQQQWAGRILARVLPHHLLRLRRDRVAFFLRANNALYESTHSIRLSFDFFDLAEELSTQIARLKELNPTILVAPPSLLHGLARHIEAGDIRVSPLRVVSVAEPLDPIDERRFETVFDQPIHQVYQATEGFLGATCERGTMHLNEDNLVFEREHLDEERFVPVITDFRRTTQPIIRYRLDDVLKLQEEPCPCGSAMTAIQSIEGRLGDVLTGVRETGGTRDIYADFIRRAILTAVPDLNDYGVRQVAVNELSLFLSPDNERTRSAAVGSLQQLFQRLHCLPPTVSALAEWPAGGMKKRRRVERAI